MENQDIQTSGDDQSDLILVLHLSDISKDFQHFFLCKIRVNSKPSKVKAKKNTPMFNFR